MATWEAVAVWVGSPAKWESCFRSSQVCSGGGGRRGEIEKDTQKVSGKQGVGARSVIIVSIARCACFSPFQVHNHRAIFLKQFTSSAGCPAFCAASAICTYLKLMLT